jgi:hypothetical protein
MRCKKQLRYSVPSGQFEDSLLPHKDKEAAN